MTRSSRKIEETTTTPKKKKSVSAKAKSQSTSKSKTKSKAKVQAKAKTKPGPKSQSKTGSRPKVKAASRKAAAKKTAPALVDKGLTPHQEKVYGAFFEAVEHIGHRLEKTEAERDRLASRLEEIESQFERDSLTGKYYLPAKIDGDDSPGEGERVSGGSRSVLLASVFSLCIAVAALGVVLTQKPGLTPEQVAALQFNTLQFSQFEPQTPLRRTGESVSLAAQDIFEPAATPEEEMAVSENVADQQTADVAASALPDRETAAALNSVEPAAGTDNGNKEPEEIKAQEPAETPPSQTAETAAKTPEPFKKPVAEKPVKTEAKAKAPAPAEKTQSNVAAAKTKADAPWQQKLPVKKTAADKPKAAAKGITSDVTLPEALRPLEARALAGVASAQHDLATLYAAGNAIPLNYERAALWFSRAADAGIANAHYNLGVMAHQGLGRSVDLPTALKWYHNAAELGHAEALYNLGIAYTEGVGAGQDIERGVEYFKRAANAGVSQAAYNLGILHESNFLGGVNREEALTWYKKAADSGNREAAAAYQRLSGTSQAQTASAAAGAAEAEVQSPQSLDRIEPAAGASHINEEDLTVAVQKYLIFGKYLPGQADGILDIRTRDAIRSYERDTGLPSSGTPSEALLAHMQANF